jgi:uncharacterized protein YerC
MLHGSIIDLLTPAEVRTLMDRLKTVTAESINHVLKQPETYNMILLFTFYPYSCRP